MASATPNFESGINADCLVGTVEVALEEWTFNRTSQMVEFINSKTGVNPAVSPTFRRHTVTVFLSYDEANDPLTGTTPTFQEGMFVSALKLIKDKTMTPQVGWLIPSALVLSVQEGAKVADKIGIQISLRVNGGYTAISS